MGDMQAYNELNLTDLEGVSGGVLLKDMTSKERKKYRTLYNKYENARGTEDEETAYKEYLEFTDEMVTKYK
jgi:acyl-CoA-binding protein